MNTARNDEPVEFIRLPEVIKLVGYKTSKIYEMAKTGDFPKQVKLGGRSVAWVKSEVIAWNRAQVEAARTGQDASTVSK
ncbi:AlpA family transcriptional regulator [Pseudomonas alliivorans]|nr:AlpA family transcriptional regulator [Pseudomonas alliivorans]MEE4688786.1 AlpA family transcriptional regulator [Pseudomonas alliivorans]MEE4710220.1 AlpA family transcriptional regulator [Pseudomonas alliivorans]MEE4725173.1 AlpA family transcriptional regulator [Pseudomonas alliivorans]MEE4765966.1 AlpA family transcriptional regulator [Pseudomonas alliivorans]